MIKAVLKDWEKIVIEDAPIPEIDEGEALIKISYAGLCGSDVSVYLHHHATATVPRIQGHEFCGRIADIKPLGDCNLKIVDLVTSHPINSCGKCAPCLTGRSNACQNLEVYGVHVDGSFAEYIKVPINKVYKLNDNVDEVVATLVEPLTVAVHDLRLVEFRGGQSALVISAGTLNSLTPRGC